MGVLRSELQSKINTIKEIYPDGNLDFIKEQISAWLDTQNLANIAFNQDEMRDRILSDLDSYGGLA